MKVKTLITSYLALFMAVICQAQVVVTTDTVSGKWTAGSSPYILTRNTIVPKDTTLIIEAGTEVRFTGNYTLKVDGRLIAKATKKKAITFAFADSADLAEYRSISDTSDTGIDGWKGIRFSENRAEKDTSILAHCIIKGVKALTGTGSHCSGGGISITGDAPVIIRNCFISGNQAHIGAAIYCSGKNVIIEGNVIENNKSLSNGGAIYFSQCRPVVKNNLIRFNISPEFGGGMYCYKTSGNFVNNTLVENRARFGGAISLVKSDIRLINNTISDNHAGSNGGGIHCQQSSPFIKNSILWGNDAGEKGKQLYLFSFGYPDIVYSTIQGGLQAIERFSSAENQVNRFEYNLEDDPKLIKDDTAYYALAELSPCIDAGLNHDEVVSEGLDMNGNPRIVNHIIDMGSQEFILAEKSDLSEIKKDEIITYPRLTANIFPNPNKGKFAVEISGSECDIGFLGVVNANGQAIYTQSISFGGPALKQQVELDISRGMYFVELKNGKGEVLKREKMIIE